MNEHFDQLLLRKIKNSFDDLQVAPGENLWEEFLVKQTKKKEVKRGFTRRALAVAALIALFFTGIISIQLLREGANSHDEFVYNQQQKAQESPITDQKSVSPSLSAPVLQEEVSESQKAQRLEENEEEVLPKDDSETKEKSNEILPVIRRANFNELPAIRVQESIAKRLVGEEKVNMDSSSDPTIVVERFNKKSKALEFHISSGSSYYRPTNSSAWSYSGGVTSELMLTEKISISGGIALAKQGFEIANNGVDITQESEIDEIGIKKYADLITLDIPINTRYYFKNSNAGESYISFGISSFIYLQESVTTSTRQVIEVISQENGIPVVTREVEESETKNTQKAFTNLDIARAVNISIGIERSVNNSLSFIVEPFMQIPIGTLTSEKIRFGTGGMNVRFKLN